MQIPGIDRFGADQAAPPQRSDGAGVFNDAGAGAMAIGRTLGGMAQEAQQREQQERSAKTQLALATITNDLHSAHAAVAQGVLDGSIDPDKAGAEMQKQARDVASAGTQGLNLQPFERDMMNAHITTQVGALDQNLQHVVMARKQSETASTIDQAGEQFQRQAPQLGAKWVTDKYSALVDFSGPAAGWTPEVQAKKKQQFAENTTYGFFDAAGTDALTKGDVAGVTGVLQKIQGPEGEALDPAKRARLEHQMFGYQQHLLAQQQRDANAAAEAQRIRDNAAIDALNKGMDLFQSGKAFSPDYIKELTAVSAGTSSDKDVVGLLAAQAAGAGFATKPQAERDATLAQWTSDASNKAIGTNPAEEKAIDVLQKMNAKLKTAADQNPWQAASSVGLIPATPEINASTGPASLQVLGDRMKMIGQVENYVGHKVSPLQPTEAEQIGKMVRSLPVDQASTLLGSFGAMLNDSERVSAVAKQVAEKDPDVGVAMMYATAGTTQGRLTGELVLRGAQAIKDKVVTVDGANETGWKATISKEVRGVFSNRQAEDLYVDAAFKIAAAKYAQNGSADLPEAIKLATGGIVERNGFKVPLPYGMKEDDFDKRIGAIKQSDLISQVGDGYVLVGRTPMPLPEFVATLPKAGLVDAGQGLYSVRAGTATVTNSAGKRIVLKVNP